MKAKNLVKVKYTNGIPICPFCKVPTKRGGSQGGSSTAMYFPPQYDEKGNNINPDRNIITTNWQCLKCTKYYVVSGNQTDGYQYKI